MSGEPHLTLIEAPVHGRLLWRLPGEGPAGALVVGFHGYAESADRLLAELDSIPGADRWARAAIQALHPFYNSRSGEVVASWMTRLDRERAIADNIGYVERAVAALRAIDGLAGVPLVYVGFSQGVAMAYRAAVGCTHPCRGVVALAGDVPPEVAARELGGFPPVLVARGRDDEWYDDAKLAADLEVLRGKGIAVESFVFDGGHLWTDSFRRRCAAFVEEAASA